MRASRRPADGDLLIRIGLSDRADPGGVGALTQDINTLVKEKSPESVRGRREGARVLAERERARTKR